MDRRVFLKKTALMVALAGLFFALAVMLVDRLLQDSRIYEPLSKVVKNYDNVVNEDGTWYAIRTEKPFVQPTDESMRRWDAEHYDDMRQNLSAKYQRWHGFFAFYPGFPLFWHLLHVGPLGISVVNWILYLIGLVLVSLLFGDRLPRWSYALLLCAPFAVIFMIPYSEALFFLGIAMGMMGLVKNRYWLYFVGFFVACSTRAAGNILAVAWIIADLLSALQARSSIKETLRNIGLHLAPIAAAVLTVVVIQHFCGAEHWFEYVLAQKEWGKELSWPTWPLTDWSEEGESVTKPLIFTLFIPALVWLALSLLKAIKSEERRPMETMEVLRLLSVLFFVGNVILALLTQHGRMFSQARLLTCTPFFAFLVLDLSAAPKEKAWRWGMLAALLVAAFLCRKMFFNPVRIGCWIVFLLAILVFFGDRMKPRFRTALTAACITLNVYWTAYLFNCFLAGGWIFT